MAKKINYSVCFVCLMVLAIFSSLLTANNLQAVQWILLVMMMVSGMFANVKNSKLAFRKRIPRYYAAWLLFAVFVLVGIQHNYFGTMRIVCCLLLCFILSRDTAWIDIMKKCMVLFTGINVIATYFLLIFPQFYYKVIDMYGYIPEGTSNGTAGYRAGIANHYSQNGIYISILLLVLMTMLLSKYKKSKGFLSKNKFLLACIFLTVVALMITGKRGVLVWSVFAIVLSFMISYKFKISSILKFLFTFGITILLLYLLSLKIPAVAYVLERFQRLGEDKASLERLDMWRLAIEKFKQSPIFGNGFWIFRRYYNESNFARTYHYGNDLYKSMNAHNVYLQLLCETGIVGFTVYVSAIILVLARTIKLVKQIDLSSYEEYRFGIMLSLSLQIFYIVYSMSGNCLYDLVFYFYAVALALTMSISLSVSRQKKLDMKNNSRR